MKSGYKTILESNKIVISNNNVVVGRDYIQDDLLKFNIIPKFVNNIFLLLWRMLNHIVFILWYISLIMMNVESYNLWYGRLWYSNFGSINKMNIFGLTPKIKENSNSKYEICI